jgi:hypothetical protein
MRGSSLGLLWLEGAVAKVQTVLGHGSQTTPTNPEEIVYGDTFGNDAVRRTHIVVPVARRCRGYGTVTIAAATTTEIQHVGNAVGAQQRGMQGGTPIAQKNIRHDFGKGGPPNGLAHKEHGRQNVDGQEEAARGLPTVLDQQDSQHATVEKPGQQLEIVRTESTNKVEGE